MKMFVCFMAFLFCVASSMAADTTRYYRYDEISGPMKSAPSGLPVTVYAS